ncbi:pentatricopeptide repeat-containing protein At4g01030, mitochondrial [Cornus florida]|uniref:pentatricopeptide repeat-containing protein At4g01030, mitochondrial n=1 Tax=Cornus florida TaxID=4283 RepID=UPI0028A0D584|nr:pentatricopeptide repeat-containing protein At4g01030, mitochondrial [Cornus florida]
MGTIIPLQYLNPSFLQNSHTKKRPKSHSSIFSLLRVAETSLCSSPPPSSPTLPCLNGFNELQSLNSVKVMHAQMIKMVKKRDSDPKMQSLITSYLEFGDFRSAAMIFLVCIERNYVWWNAFLEDFKSFGGNPHEILEVFGELQSKGVIFDSGVLTVILKVCGNLMDIWLGLEIHSCLIKRGFDLDVYLKCALMNYYGRCWGIDSVNQAFYEMPDPQVLLWNEAILVNLTHDRWVKALKLFRDMQFSLVKANSFTIAKVLQACGKVGALEQGKQIHGYVIRFALESNTLVCNSLVSMYSKNGNLELAKAVFDSMENRSISSWNSIISGYTSFGCVNDAWKLFHEMESSDMKPDIITWNSLLSGHFLHGSYQQVVVILQRMQTVGFKPNASSVISVLQAISELGCLNLGKEVHGYVIRNRVAYDLYVGTSLVDMYVKNDDLTSARAAFDSMKNRNIFAWNSLISGYAFKGRFDEAVTLLHQMEKERIKPDLVTYNGLVSGYSMSNHSKEALAMIRQIKSSGLIPNVVSWTALISGCSQKGNYKDALKFSIQMQQEGIKPNSATIASLLRACAGLSFLQKGKEIHCLTIRNGFSEDAFVATALIDMYSKCGSLKNAHKVFQNIQNKTSASWNCMIMGFAINSLGREAISIFDEMREVGIQPDAITFTALLSSCKHSGLIDEGWKYFDSMKAGYGIIPTIEHCSCMVDLLGRAGYLDEAWDFIQSMPMEPDATVWGALLRSCQIHGNLELAEIAAKNLFKLEPYNPANYVLMMNLYTILNRWEDVEHIKDSMDVIGVKPGHEWSWIQINQIVHVFCAVGKPHPEEAEIFFELYQLISEMKKLGYLPDVKRVYQNVDDVEKEKLLLAHTEKLAIAYGLIKTKGSAPIRVIKNTRVCHDCHTAAKFMSLIRTREIFLKDGVRFHHFREGKCSCNDVW